MPIFDKEQKIKKIINLEERIIHCQRCEPALQCVYKPSLGKGDLQPEALLVFESDNTFSDGLKKFLKIRKIILGEFELENIYHTFLVRCQAKACPNQSNLYCQGEYKLINYDYKCILSDDQCDGIPIRPNNEQIFACLPYLIEEIEVLSPKYLFLFGDKVANYVLKSWGLFKEYSLPFAFNYNYCTIFLVDYEEDFTINYCKELKTLTDNIGKENFIGM